MLHWMPYCLLLSNVYRIGDVIFLSGYCPNIWDQIMYMHPWRTRNEVRKTKLMQDDELSLTSFCFVNVFPTTNFWFASLICILIVGYIFLCYNKHHIKNKKTFLVRTVLTTATFPLSPTGPEQHGLESGDWKAIHKRGLTRVREHTPPETFDFYSSEIAIIAHFRAKSAVLSQYGNWQTFTCIARCFTHYYRLKREVNNVSVRMEIN